MCLVAGAAQHAAAVQEAEPEQAPVARGRGRSRKAGTPRRVAADRAAAGIRSAAHLDAAVSAELRHPSLYAAALEDSLSEGPAVTQPPPGGQSAFSSC